MARGQPEGEQVYRPEVEPENLPRKLVPEIRQGPVLAEDFSRAAGAVSDAVDRKYQADSATFAGDQLADFRIKAIQNLEEMKQQAPAGDPGNFTERYLQSFDKQAEPLAASVEDNPYASGMVHNGLRELRTQLATHVMTWEAVQRKSYQNDSVGQNLNGQLPLVRAHPELATSVGSTLADQVNATSNEPSEKLAMMREVHSKLTTNASLGLADQDARGVYEQLMGGAKRYDQLDELTDPSARTQVLDAARAGVVKGTAQGIVGAYRAAGPQDGGKAFGALDSMPFPGTDEQQEALRNDVRAQVHTERASLIAEQQQKLGPDIMRVEESLRSGDPAPGTRSQIWGLYRQNALEPHVAGAELGELDRIEQSQAEDHARIASVQKCWDGSCTIDPKDKQNKADVSDFFDALAKANNAAPGSQAWINLGAEASRRLGVIPESLGSWARGTLAGSQDPKQVMSAVDAIERVRQAAPRSFPYFDDDTRLAAMADSIASLTKAGVPPPEALAMARSNAQNGEKHRDLLDEMWKGARPFGPDDQNLESVIKGQVGSDPRLSQIGWLSNSTPPIPPLMREQYKTLTRALFQYNGGNVQNAERDAARWIGTPWGLSLVNGTPEILHYPPERMFKGLTPQAIQDDLALTIEKNSEGFREWDAGKNVLVPFHVEPQNLKLIPTADTETTSGRRWGLAYQDPTTHEREVVFGKDGKPLQYDLPVSREDYAAASAHARAAAITAAGERREKQEAYEKQAREDLLNDDRMSLPLVAH
jgi:hypothetical protein